MRQVPAPDRFIMTNLVAGTRWDDVYEQFT
jgi:hypothetical protein